MREFPPLKLIPGARVWGYSPQPAPSRDFESFKHLKLDRLVYRLGSIVLHFSLVTILLDKLFLEKISNYSNNLVYI